MMTITARTASVVLIAAFLLLTQKTQAWPLNPPFTLPATATIKYTLVLTTKPLTSPPTPSPLYKGRQNWTFVNVPGTLMVASYTDAPAPIGPYNELVYIPGKYIPCANAPEQMYDSVARIWVDNKASLEAGRYTGGMPKYMANFKWQLDPVTHVPINVTVRAANKTILRIVGLQPFSKPLRNTAAPDDKAETAATVMFNVQRSNLQWPIYPPGTKKPANDKPIVGSHSFDTGSASPSFLRADRVFFDQLTFTGNGRTRVRYDAAAAILSAPTGSMATSMEPVELNCP